MRKVQESKESLGTVALDKEENVLVELVFDKKVNKLEVLCNGGLIGYAVPKYDTFYDEWVYLLKSIPENNSNFRNSGRKWIDPERTVRNDRAERVLEKLAKNEKRIRIRKEGRI